MKNLPHDAERTVLIIPDTPPSDGSQERPTATRSFSLNKVFFASSAKVTNSLPVTPIANSGPEPVQDGHRDNHSEFSVSDLCLFICITNSEPPIHWSCILIRRVVFLKF